MDENQVGKKRRTRRTGKEVQRLVEEFISGGMKRSEFCRTRGLSPGTLQRRLKGEKQRGRQIPRLVAVELEQKAAQKANAIEVVLAGGRRVEVRPGFDATTLQAVIAVLEGYKASRVWNRTCDTNLLGCWSHGYEKGL